MAWRALVLVASVVLSLSACQHEEGEPAPASPAVIDRWEAVLPDPPVTAGVKYTARLHAASDLNWIVGTSGYAGGVNSVYGAGVDFGLTTYVR